MQTLLLFLCAVSASRILFGSDGDMFAAWRQDTQLITSLSLNTYDPALTHYSERYMYLASSADRMLERIARDAIDSSSTLINVAPLSELIEMVSLVHSAGEQLGLLYTNSRERFALAWYNGTLESWGASVEFTLDASVLSACVCGALYLLEEQQVHEIALETGQLVQSFPLEHHALDLECSTDQQAIVVISNGTTLYTQHLSSPGTILEVLASDSNALFYPKLHDHRLVEHGTRIEMIGALEMPTDSSVPLSSLSSSILYNAVIQVQHVYTHNIEITGVTEFHGPNAGVLVQGNVHFQGDLIISLDSVPEDGESITLFTFGSSSGSFDNIIVQADSLTCQIITAEENRNNDSFQVVFNVYNDEDCTSATSTLVYKFFWIHFYF